MKRILSVMIAVMMLLAAIPTLSLADAATQEEITVTILVPQDPGLRPKQSTSLVWDYIREQTGINFERQIVQGSDQVQLMFASRDYPDMMASVGASATQLMQAADAGDLVDL